MWTIDCCLAWKNTKCFLSLRRGKKFLDNSPFLLMKISLCIAFNKHVCYKAILRHNILICLPLPTEGIRRKPDSSTPFVPPHLDMSINSYYGSTIFFRICFSTIIIGLNQRPVSRRHVNKQESTYPELLSVKMLSFISAININKGSFYSY